MSRELRILVPRLMDAANTNAQNLNARALLSRFTSPSARWMTTHYDEPDPIAARAPRVTLTKLWRTRLWNWRMLVFYQQRCDGIFYPGVEWFDDMGLGLRRATRSVPVIGTLEGIAGDEAREKELESVAGHRVLCHRISREAIARCDRMLRACDHIIAITPMLAKLGRHLYGDKFSMLPLGIDTKVFHRTTSTKNSVFRVIGVGNVKENKRPSVFLELAGRFPEAEFVWFGQGPLLEAMRKVVTESGRKNITFPGTALPSQLAEEYNRSHVFLLPSFSEGAPKVLQEAGASGLARIAFGFYEPAIRHGVDGFVVWDDNELTSRIGELIHDEKLVQEMGVRAAETASRQDWSLVAPQWENEILTRVQQSGSR